MTALHRCSLLLSSLPLQPPAVAFWPVTISPPVSTIDRRGPARSPVSSIGKSVVKATGHSSEAKGRRKVLSSQNRADKVHDAAVCLRALHAKWAVMHCNCGLLHRGQAPKTCSPTHEGHRGLTVLVESGKLTMPPSDRLRSGPRSGPCVASCHGCRLTRNRLHGA
jgi:hypothetical protein